MASKHTPSDAPSRPMTRSRTCSPEVPTASLKISNARKRTLGVANLNDPADTVSETSKRPRRNPITMNKPAWGPASLKNKGNQGSRNPTRSFRKSPSPHGKVSESDGPTRNRRQRSESSSSCSSADEEDLLEKKPNKLVDEDAGIRAQPTPRSTLHQTQTSTSTGATLDKSCDAKHNSSRNEDVYTTGAAFLQETSLDPRMLQTTIDDLVQNILQASLRIHSHGGVSSLSSFKVIQNAETPLRTLYERVFDDGPDLSWNLRDLLMDAGPRKSSVQFLAALIGAFILDEILDAPLKWEDASYDMPVHKDMIHDFHKILGKNALASIRQLSYFRRVQSRDFKAEITTIAANLVRKFYSTIKGHLEVMIESGTPPVNTFEPHRFVAGFGKALTGVFESALSLRANIDATHDRYTFSWPKLSSGFDQDNMKVFITDQNLPDATRLGYAVFPRVKRHTLQGKPHEHVVFHGRVVAAGRINSNKAEKWPKLPPYDVEGDPMQVDENEPQMLPDWTNEELLMEQSDDDGLSHAKEPVLPVEPDASTNNGGTTSWLSRIGSFFML